MNLIRVLHHVCGQYPDKTAFVERETSVSFREFYRAVGETCAGLRQAGIGPGDRVLVLVPLSTELYITLCAVWALGAGTVMFDPSAGREHVQSCLKELPVKAFVGTAKSLMLRWISPPIRRIPMFLDVATLRGNAGDNAVRIADVQGDTPALITFTSGSTATPKAIVRTHDFLLRQRDALIGCMPYGEDDIDLAVMPVFTLMNLVEGITTVLADDSLRNISKVNAHRLVAQIKRHGINRITASPALLDRLCGCAERQKDALSGLRSVHVGGGPVFLDFLERLSEQVPARAIEIVYGSTEAEPISTMHWTDMTDQQKMGMKSGAGLLVGAPVDTIQIAVIRNCAGTALEALSPAEFEAMKQPVGKAGEIVVAGEHVVQGYLRAEQDRDNKIRVGDTVWHRTGDCGRIDAGGYLWLLGRAGQVLHHGKAEIYPFAVESAIRAAYHCRSAICTDAHGAPVLVVEQCAHVQSISREYGTMFHRVLPVKKIPMDRRHASKVDYVALRKLVEKKGGR